MNRRKLFSALAAIPAIAVLPGQALARREAESPDSVAMVSPVDGDGSFTVWNLSAERIYLMRQGGDVAWGLTQFDPIEPHGAAQFWVASFETAAIVEHWTRQTVNVPVRHLTRGCYLRVIKRDGELYTAAIRQRAT